MYQLTFTAVNDAGSTTQSFTMTITAAPTVTSAATASATTGATFGFVVRTSRAPVPAITETGALPAGITLVDNGDGTANLAGTPTTAGTYTLTITATNGVGTATQTCKPS